MKVQKIFDIPLPEYKTKQAAGLDLYAAIEAPVVLGPLQRVLIPTGIKIQLEKGYEAQIRPRSGISLFKGITLVNCVGTIDADYRGEIKLPVINLSHEVQTINPKDRIAQMIISRYERVTVEEVNELDDTERGEGGFGSTGI